MDFYLAKGRAGGNLGLNLGHKPVNTSTFVQRKTQQPQRREVPREYPNQVIVPLKTPAVNRQKDKNVTVPIDRVSKPSRVEGSVLVAPNYYALAVRFPNQADDDLLPSTRQKLQRDGVFGP